MTGVKVSKQTRRNISQISIFITVILFAFAARLMLNPYVTGVPYITFFPAIVAISCLCSMRLSFIAIIIFLLLGDYFFMPPYYNFFWQAKEINFNAVIGALMFAVSGALIALLTEFAQSEIRRRKQVELQLQRMTYVLRRSNDDLMRSNNELEQFASVASHDLQEPLRMIVNYVDLFEMAMGEKLGKEGREYLTTISDSARRSQSLIRALLEYAQVGFKAQATEIDMNEVMQKVTRNVKASIDESKAEVHIEKLPVIQGDQYQLVQLFQNLISNAIKYRANNTAPQINVSCLEDPLQWVFCVKDNGIGIASQHQKKIFELFQRLHNRQQYSGTGIGLAICAKISANLGGKIWVESKGEGQGSTFCVSIPKPAKDSNAGLQ